MTLYKVVRYYQNNRKPKVLKTNLTLEKAQEWCNDPETSSRTASQANGGCADDEKMIKRWDAANKHWFDGYTEDK